MSASEPLCIVSNIFEADFKRVVQIRESLGPVGRVKEKTGVQLCV